MVNPSTINLEWTAEVEQTPKSYYLTIYYGIAISGDPDTLQIKVDDQVLEHCKFMGIRRSDIFLGTFRKIYSIQLDKALELVYERLSQNIWDYEKEEIQMFVDDHAQLFRTFKIREAMKQLKK